MGKIPDGLGVFPGLPRHPCLATTLKSLPDVGAFPGTTLVIGNGRSPEVIAFETQIVEFFVDVAGTLNLPKSVAAIYGILFASPVPLTFAEIESRLDFSKGSISQGLRTLREIGAIKEVSAPSDRAELFQPDTEMRQIIAHFLASRVDDQLQSAKRRFDAFNGALAAFPNGEQKILKQRLHKLQRWHKRTQALLPVIRTFLKLGA